MDPMGNEAWLTILNFSCNESTMLLPRFAAEIFDASLLNAGRASYTKTYFSIPEKLNLKEVWGVHGCISFNGLV